jgi:NAD-dependent dihydropyrimidine dehydrogenase PreA subunit
VAYVITQPCVDCKDRSCVEVCPTDCIYEGERMLYIHPDECVDCGACEVCPVNAVFSEDEVPEQWAAYTEANRAFFAEVGSPGGATGAGLLRHDPQWILDLPPQEGC